MFALFPPVTEATKDSRVKKQCTQHYEREPGCQQQSQPVHGNEPPEIHGENLRGFTGVIHDPAGTEEHGAAIFGDEDHRLALFAQNFQATVWQVAIDRSCGFFFV